MCSRERDDLPMTHEPKRPLAAPGTAGELCATCGHPTAVHLHRDHGGIACSGDGGPCLCAVDPSPPLPHGEPLRTDWTNTGSPICPRCGYPGPIGTAGEPSEDAVVRIKRAALDLFKNGDGPAFEATIRSELATAAGAAPASPGDFLRQHAAGVPDFAKLHAEHTARQLDDAAAGAAPADGPSWKQRYEEEAAAHRLAHAQWLEVRAERDALRGAAPADEPSGHGYAIAFLLDCARMRSLNLEHDDAVKLRQAAAALMSAAPADGYPVADVSVRGDVVTMSWATWKRICDDLAGATPADPNAAGILVAELWNRGWRGLTEADALAIVKAMGVGASPAVREAAALAAEGER